MKKLLYIAAIYMDFEKPDGVDKKVLNHLGVFSKYFDSKLVAYGSDGIQAITNQGVEVKKYGNNHRRFELYEYVRALIQFDNFDYIYIRYPKSDPQFIKLLKTLKKTSCKIVMEIPTYPYNGEMFRSIKTVAIAAVDAIYQNQLKKYIDRIVTYSDDDYIFAVKTIRTVNGVVFDKIVRRKVSAKDDTITLIAVAMLSNCHGYDRIIEGLNNYYTNGARQNIVFHIVGIGSVVPRYKSLIEKYNLSDHVILEGYCNGRKLNQLYDDSDIAVNSIAIHRIKLKKESTLKTKEYAAKGLPMISSYSVDAFDEIGNQRYVLKVPSDESPVDVQAIIDFFHGLYDDMPEEELMEHIRKDSLKICDMEITLNSIIDFFNS